LVLAKVLKQYLNQR